MNIYHSSSSNSFSAILFLNLIFNSSLKNLSFGYYMAWTTEWHKFIYGVLEFFTPPKPRGTRWWISTAICMLQPQHNRDILTSIPPIITKDYSFYLFLRNSSNDFTAFFVKSLISSTLKCPLPRTTNNSCNKYVHSLSSLDICYFHRAISCNCACSL